MKLIFTHRHPPDGRIIAYLGDIAVGAIYPERPRWRWKLHLPGAGAEKHARSELAAKSQMNDALRDWFRRAGSGVRP